MAIYDSFSTFGQMSKKPFDKSLIIASKNQKINLKYLFSQIWAILGNNFIVFIKFIGAILSKSRETIIDCQLISLLENCLKTQLVGFRWPDSQNHT